MKLSDLEALAKNLKWLEEHPLTRDDNEYESLRQTYTNLTQNVKDVDWKNIVYSP